MSAIVIYNKTKAKLNLIRFYIFTIILLNYIFFKKNKHIKHVTILLYFYILEIL